MSYDTGNVILDNEYNLFVTGTIGGTNDPAVAALNSVWSVGNQNKGYGQTAVLPVGVGNLVYAAEWNSLFSNTANAAVHQNSSITAISAVSIGDKIVAIPGVQTNLDTIYSNRLNAVIQGSTVANTATMATPWQNSLTFTHTANFASGDEARYFFNAGGQLSITCSHPTGSTIDLLLSDLAANIGTVKLSAPASGTITIASTPYTGITRIGGGGSSPTISLNSGYYALGTSDANVFYQTASTGPGSYLGTFINIFVKTTAPVGSNNDNGNVITFTTVWDEMPDGMTATAGSATTLTVHFPEAINISNTWHTVSTTATVTGS